LPLIRLILVEEKTEPLLNQLRNGQMDCALMAMPIHDDFLDCEDLFEDEFLLAVPEGHPLADKPEVDQQELQGETLLLLEDGHCLRGQALQICQAAGIDEEQDVRATSLETLRQMVRAGTGITLMPHLAVREETGIRYLPFAQPAPKRKIGLVWRSTSARKALIAKLSELIRQAVG
jgi:LysR family hydrogen peroxide-inducible transcriptional activator